MLSSIENYYERLVLDRIREIMEETGEPVDTDYIDDVACVALNYLPPRYVRHSVDLASHLSDAEWEALVQEVKDAVGFAFETTRRRHDNR